MSITTRQLPKRFIVTSVNDQNGRTYERYDNVVAFCMGDGDCWFLCLSSGEIVRLYKERWVDCLFKTRNKTSQFDWLDLDIINDVDGDGIDENWILADDFVWTKDGPYNPELPVSNAYQSLYGPVAC